MSAHRLHRVRIPRLSRVIEAAALVAAVGFGWWVAQGGLDTPPPPQAAPLPLVSTATGLRLRTDASWERVRELPAVPGFSKADAAAFRPTPGIDTYVIVQRLPLQSRSLLPAALSASAGEPRATTFDGRPAWQYSGVSAKRWTLDVLAMPTTSGVVTVACATQTQNQVAAGCGFDGLRSIDTTEGRALRPSANLAFQRRLATILPDLNRARIRTGRTLLRADGPIGQGSAARRMRTIYRDAAGRLRPLDGPGATRNLSVALTNTGAAYRRLSIAATNRNRGQWNAAREVVRGAEASLARRVKAAQG